MYIIKVKGKDKIPDYIQLRDDDFTLLAYFRADRPDKALEKHGLVSQTVAILKLIQDLPFGKIHKIEL